MARQTVPSLASATPAALGYRFPAEWEPHAATWFSWPRPEGISFPDKYETVPPVLAEIIRHIAPRERVCINVPNAVWEQTVRGILESHDVPTENVRFFHIPTNETGAATTAGVCGQRQQASGIGHQ